MGSNNRNNPNMFGAVPEQKMSLAEIIWAKKAKQSEEDAKLAWALSDQAIIEDWKEVR